MISKAVILAGGVGSRIQGVEPGLPKPLINVGGKPVLHHQVDLLVQHGIREIFFLLNYLPEKIEDYFQSRSWGDLKLHFVRETEPLGTAGGLTLLKKSLQDDFFLLYGDIMVNMDLHRLASFHLKTGAMGTLVTHPNDHPYDSDLVEVDSEHRVSRLLPKKERPQDFLYDNNVNAALYVFSPRVLESIRPEKADIFQDIFPRLLEAGEHLAAYQTFEYLKDMGTPDRLELVRKQFDSGYIQRRSMHSPQKAIFLDRDGTLNDSTELVYRLDQFDLYPFAGEAVRKINKSGFLAICTTNQPVIARNLCSLDDLSMIHKKLATQLGMQHAYLDGLYFCPHHPDKGYPEERPEYKISCTCRKPGRGMIDRALADFNVDPSQSWVIGDRTADLQLAKNCGMRCILVETGDAGLDAQYPAREDFRAPDLAKAVEIVLEYQS